MSAAVLGLISSRIDLIRRPSISVYQWLFIGGNRFAGVDWLSVARYDAPRLVSPILRALPAVAIFMHSSETADQHHIAVLHAAREQQPAIV
jgi:hypothetical protein